MCFILFAAMTAASAATAVVFIYLFFTLPHRRNSVTVFPRVIFVIYFIDSQAAYILKFAVLLSLQGLSRAKV